MPRPPRERKTLTPREREASRVLSAELAQYKRPRSRAECAGGPRPCPWVGCRFHLYLDVRPDTGTLTLNFPGIEPDDLPCSCAMDVAEGGAHSLREVGLFVGLSYERIRQVEAAAIAKAQEAFSDCGDPICNPDGRHPLEELAEVFG